jgi:hypothetical protein
MLTLATTPRSFSTEIACMRKIRNSPWQMPYAISTPTAKDANTAPANMIEIITCSSRTLRCVYRPFPSLPKAKPILRRAVVIHKIFCISLSGKWDSHRRIDLTNNNLPS